MIHRNPLTVRFIDPNGLSIDLRVGADSKVELADEPYGINNVSGEVPNGRYDVRNTRVTYLDNGERIVVMSPEGTSRIYRKNKRLVYLLEKEVLPNGKILRYSYNGQELRLIESCDPLECYVYASIAVEGTPLTQSCKFSTNTGQSASYHYELRTEDLRWKEGRGFLERTKAKRKLAISPPLLSAVNSPLYRHETLHYTDMFVLDNQKRHDLPFKCVYREVPSTEGAPHLRVERLLFSSDQGNEQTAYTMSYAPPKAGRRGGKTTVISSDGSTVVYHFTKQLLPEKTLCYGTHNHLCKQTFYEWNDRQWLTAIEIRDAQNQLLSRKSYEYDSFGNPIITRFSGDLTGDGLLTSTTIGRTYSQDGRNLLLREETDTGKVTCFTYLPNTNLVTSKLVQEGSRILKREFFDYDVYCNLIQKIVDDGTTVNSGDLEDVTQRTLTKYTLRDKQPFLHMIESMELDTRRTISMMRRIASSKRSIF